MDAGNINIGIATDLELELGVTFIAIAGDVVGNAFLVEQIGNLLGVTRERIRQLRDRALRRLREGGKGDALESFAA